jgi:hypothetical protein
MGPDLHRSQLAQARQGSSMNRNPNPLVQITHPHKTITRTGS